MLVPELLGLNCRTETIAAAVRHLLENDEARRSMEAGYEEIRIQLGGELPRGATERTMEILEEMLDQAAGGNSSRTSPPSSLA
jgi:lipid A disaccharide synthetase